MFFQISPTKTEKKLKPPVKENESEKLETLSLSPFTSLPKLFFDCVKLEQTAIRKLLIKNTTHQEVTLFVTTNIPQELNVSFNWNQTTIKIDEEVLFEITWNPLSLESVRYIITFEDFKKIRRDVPIAFKSVGNKRYGAPSKIQKSKHLSKKSPAKKYYSSKPPNISPRKCLLSCKRTSPLSNKIKKKSPLKKYSKFQTLPEIQVNSCSKSSKNNTFNKGKENFPQSFVNNCLTESYLFESPKNTFFLLENNVPPRTIIPYERRETYALKSETPHIPIVDYNVRRETYAINDIPKISSVVSFDDSLENSPKLSPLNPNRKQISKSSKLRTPLKLYNEENILSQTAYKSPNETGFEYKLMHNSFSLSPTETPNKGGTFVPSLSSTIEMTKLDDILDVPKSFYLFPKHNDTELPYNNTIDVNSGTFRKSNSSFQENCSFETYVKTNLSGNTYTKDSSVGNIEYLSISPSSTKVHIPAEHPSVEDTHHLSSLISKETEQKQSNYSQEKSLQHLSFEDHCPVSDWFTKLIEQKQLSSIQEESYINTTKDSESFVKHSQSLSLKRKLDMNFTTLPPKRSNLPNGPNNWSKKGGTATRIAKHVTGLNLKQFVNKKKRDQEHELIAEVTKTDTYKMIVKDPFLLAATNMLDPFMTPGLYVNQEWIEQQEIYFKKWLNALLTPPKDLSSEEQVVDVARVWQECKKREIEDVPSKEVLSNNYHTNTRLNNLRKAAQDLFRSNEIATVLSKVYLAVDQGKLSIREDKDFHLNLSVKSEIMSMLLSYNSLWLRIGLETIYNEIIPLSSNSDIVGLSAFIVNRLLKDPYLVRKYKYIHNPKYTSCFNKFFLKKFFTLVYFLDQAKNKKLISHDPCLFCKNGVVKESKELLLRLAREILSAIGDITKVLKFLGYVVTHMQQYIHEFDYTVKNLGVDLRDGIRLTKVLELIVLKDNLTLSLRVPPISRLQKIHNMKIVFGSLEQAGYTILYNISPKDIVDGHREKTLSFLWQIIYKFEAPLMVKSAKTIQTWFRSIPIILKRRKLAKDRLKMYMAANKIQKWYRKHIFLESLTRFTKLLLKYLKMKKTERAAIKIQTFYRMYSCRKKYHKLIQTVAMIQVRSKGWLVRNVYKKQIHSAILIQSYIRMFIARRRFSQLNQSVIMIQNRYRSKKVMESVRNYFLKLRWATIIIQQRFRGNRIAVIEQHTYEQLKFVTIKIQQRFRANKLYKLEHKRYLNLRSATIQIQSWYRSKIYMRNCLQKYRAIKKSVLVIEEHFIAFRVMRLERNNYLALKSATVFIQQYYRARKVMKIQRNNYMLLKYSAIIIQRRYRANSIMKDSYYYHQKLKLAVVTVQTKFRALLAMRLTQKKYQEIRTATVKIQIWIRATLKMRRCRNYYLHLKSAVKIIEERVVANKLMLQNKQSYFSKKLAVITIQQQYRAFINKKRCQREFVRLKLASIFIQNKFRAKRLAITQRTEFLKRKEAAIIIQRRFRARKSMLKFYYEFHNLKTCAIIIQRTFRSHNVMKQTMELYLRTRTSIIKIQRWYRSYKMMLNQRNYFVSLKNSVVTIQQRWRAMQSGKFQRNSYLHLKKYTVLIQRRWRANKLAEKEQHDYTDLQKSVKIVQNRWRAKKIARQIRKEYIVMKKACIILQQKWRANKLYIQHNQTYQSLKQAVLIVQRRWRAQKLMKKKRRQYLLLKNAAAIIQRCFKATILYRRARIEFLKIRKATIIIQQKWRALVLCRKDSKEFTKLKKATLIVQRRWRANKFATAEICKYKVLKMATLVIQRRWKAILLGREAKKQFKTLKQATITIQTRWQAQKISLMDQNKFIKLKNAVTCIQRRWRALRRGKKIRKNYIALKNATTTIQQRWRAKQLMQIELEKYWILKKNCLIIQRKFRSNKLMKVQHRWYIEIRTSVIIIQRYYRCYLKMKKERRNYIKLQAVVLNLQNHIRGYLVRHKYAYYLSEEAREKRKFEKTRKLAAITIQATWRGYKCRKQQHSLLEKIRKDLKKATENAEPENTLGSRSKTALQVFISEKSTLFIVIKALEELDMATRHSKEICIMMSNILPEQLYLMLSVLTRSLPEMNAAISSVNILITFCKFPPTKNYSFIPSYIDSLITLMLHWCDKESMLFPTTSTLLWLFSHTYEWKQIILTLPNFKQRFEKIRDLVTRKENMVKKMGIKGSSVFAFHKNVNMPSLYNDWGLINNARPNVFTNSVQAFLMLSRILQT